MAPITVNLQGHQMIVDEDEHPRPETTLEALQKMPAAFRKGGIGTVGNSTVILLLKLFYPYKAGYSAYTNLDFT